MVDTKKLAKAIHRRMVNHILRERPKNVAEMEAQQSWIISQLARMLSTTVDAAVRVEIERGIEVEKAAYQRGWKDACSRVSDRIGVLSMSVGDAVVHGRKLAVGDAVVRARRVVTDVYKSCPELK